MAEPHEEDLAREGERIASLLDELRAMAGPSTFARVEDLVRRILRLHGAGLDRVLALATAGNADPGLPDRLLGDELVSSLLLLHGLHPVPTRARVARALDAAQARLGGATLELVALEQGVARIRVTAAADRRAGFSGAALRAALEQAVLEAAPELTRVELDGLASGPAPERLVQLGRPRAEAGVDR